MGFVKPPVCLLDVLGLTVHPLQVDVLRHLLLVATAAELSAFRGGLFLGVVYVFVYLVKPGLGLLRLILDETVQVNLPLVLFEVARVVNHLLNLY